jgi:hypothetical protein
MTSPLIIPTRGGKEPELVKSKSLILEDNPNFQASLTKTLGGSFQKEPSLEARINHQIHTHHDSGTSTLHRLSLVLFLLTPLPHTGEGNFVLTCFHKDIDHVDVDAYGIHTNRLFRNAAAPILYEQALARETGSAVTSTGALVTSSGHKTGTYTILFISCISYISHIST